MIGWYILIGIILFITLILIIPVGVDVSFDKELKVNLRIAFLSIQILPAKPEKEKKPKKEKKKKKEEEPKEEEPKEKKPNIIKEKGISWLMDVIRQVAAIAGGMLKSFFKHLVLKKFFISITYAGENAEDTAVKYGYFCSSVYPAFSVLVRVAKCKKYAIDISPNFTNGEQSVFDIDISLRIRIFWIVALVFKHGFKAIKLLLSLRRGKKSEVEKIMSEIDPDFKEGDYSMDHPIGNLMNVTMDKIKEMVDVNTIVGEPITSSDGTLIIPVSKVSYGFASGGSDLPTKKESKDCFGGGSGAGVTIQPVAFLTVYQGDVRLINVDGNNTGIDQIISMVPDVVGKVKGVIENRKTKKAQKSGNDFAEITSDDVDV